MADSKKSDLPRRHILYVNPYTDMAFTKCPKCRAKTKVRKFLLFIHIEPDQPFVLNKVCRYCVRCGLVIVSKASLEQLMAAGFETRRPEIVGSKYLIVGTVDPRDWRAHRKRPELVTDVRRIVRVFKNEWFFEIEGGWRITP